MNEYVKMNQYYIFLQDTTTVSFNDLGTFIINDTIFLVGLAAKDIFCRLTLRVRIPYFPGVLKFVHYYGSRKNRACQRTLFFYFLSTIISK